MHRLLIVFLLLVAPASGPATSLDSQVEAQRVLAAAVQAIGGEMALRGLQSVRRDYLEDWVDVGQGERPWTGTPAIQALPPHRGFDDSEALSFLDYAGNRYYESIRYADAPSDYAVVVESGTPARAFQSIAYVHERPFFTEHAAGSRESERLRRFRRFPEGLLRMALDRVETLLWLGPVVEGGTRLEAIAFADSQGTQICLYFDAATVPGKPVRLVSTHFHFDHIGGVRTAVARGVPIVTTADARVVIERSLASTQAMRPDEYSRAPRAATIDVAGRKTVLEDGSQRVEIYDFGPTPHVTQLLVAYFPRQKLLHVADIFDVLTPELVIAGIDAVVMAERIGEFNLDVERFVPMHGVPVTIDHLRRGLEIRRKYEEKEK